MRLRHRQLAACAPARSNGSLGRGGRPLEVGLMGLSRPTANATEGCEMGLLTPSKSGTTKRHEACSTRVMIDSNTLSYQVYSRFQDAVVEIY